MEIEYLSTTEAAKKLGISRQYLLTLIKNGTIPAIREEPEGPFKIKPTWKVKTTDVDALLKKDRRAVKNVA